MRNISENFWDYFWSPDLSDDGARKRDGKKFERLVEELLNLMFRDKNIKWDRTQETHDGNKDFFAEFDGKLYWAECKNYTKDISLLPLATTLVMAELSNVNVILFFSYSSINNPTKKTLCSYSEVNRKSIHFFDGDVLDNLILKFADQLSDEFSSRLRTSNCNYTDSKPNILYYVEKDPFLNKRCNLSDEKNIFFTNIKVGQIIGIHFIFVNNSLDNTAVVRLNLKYLKDNRIFEILEKERREKKTMTSFPDFKVGPGEMHHQIIYMKLQKYVPIVTLPSLSGNYRYLEKENKKVPFRFDFGTFSCIHSRKSILMGSHYISWLDSFSEKCLNNNRFSSLLIYGKSGVGKTRMLEECSSLLVKNHYQVINFQNWKEDYSSCSVIKELIYLLYELTDELILDSLSNSYQQFEEFKQLEVRTIFELLRNLQSGNLENYQWNTAAMHLVYEKLARNKYALIIDNLQYFDKNMTEFISSLMLYMQNMQRPCLMVLLVSINVDAMFRNDTIELLADFQAMCYDNNRFLCFSVDGFLDSNQAWGFLKEILNLKNEVSNEKHITHILKGTSLRPKYIEEVANYLIEKEVIKIVDEKAYIVDSSKFERYISDIPKNFETLFQKRWNHILKCLKMNEQSFYLTLSLLFFFRPLKETLFASFQISDEHVKVLTKYGIVKREELEKEGVIYEFEHDLIKNFFKKHIPNLLNYIVDYILNHVNNYDCILKDEYTYEYFYCRVFDLTANELERLFEDSIDVSFPIHLCTSFYQQLVLRIINEMNIENNLGLKFAYIRKCSAKVAESMGEASAANIYGSARQLALETLKSSPETASMVFDYWIEYAENQVKLKEIDKAEELYHEMLHNLDNSELKDYMDSRSLDYLRAKVLNRLYVCGRVGDYCNKYIYCLDESDDICDRENFGDMRIENYFDRAHNHFLIKDGLAVSVPCLEKACELYEEHPINHLQGQYLYRSIQLKMLRGEFDDLWSEVDKYYNQILFSTTIRYKLYFRVQFTIFKLILVLIGKSPLSDIAVQSLFHEAEHYQSLQNEQQQYRISFLYTKYYIKKNDWVRANLYFNKCIDNMNQIKQTEEIRLQKKIVVKDFFVKIQYHHGPYRKVDFTYLDGIPEINESISILDYSEADFSDFFSTYEPSAPIMYGAEKDSYFLT